MDDAVTSDAVADIDAREAVDLDFDQAAVARDVDGQAAAVEQGGQIGVEEALWHAGAVVLVVMVVFDGAGVRLAVRGVVGVAVQDLVRNDVVLEDGLEVLEAVRGEEKGVDARAELLEGEVGRREEGRYKGKRISFERTVAKVDRCAHTAVELRLVECLDEAGLAECELKGGELGR